MTPDDVAFLRSIKRSAVVLIALLKSDQPLTARRLADLLELDYAAVRRYLAALVAQDLVLRLPGGYLAIANQDHSAQKARFPVPDPAPAPNQNAQKARSPEEQPNQNAQKARFSQDHQNQNAQKARSPQSSQIQNAQKARFSQDHQNQNAQKARSPQSSQIQNAQKARFYLAIPRTPPIQNAQKARFALRLACRNAQKARFTPAKTRKKRALKPLIIIIKTLKLINNNNNNKILSLPENDPDRQQLRAALAKYGVLPNARTRLLETFPHVTPQLVESTAASLNKPFPQYAGLLIRALEQTAQHPPPHPPGCSCPDCRQRYTGGRFADYVNS